MTKTVNLPRFSITLISAAALGYEILLMRLFSIIQWHHFAYMFISLALLGYGVSGTFLALFQKPLLKRFSVAFIANLVLFGISAIVCYLIAQQLPLNPEEMLWDPMQPGWLFIAYLLLAIPFFFASNCVALTITAHHNQVGRIYAMDMLGAGLGSLGSVALLFFVFPDNALLFIATLGVAAAIVACLELKLNKSIFLSLIALAVLIALIPSSWTTLNTSPYKTLPQTLQISGAKLVEEYSSPLGLISVVESPQIPWRHAPGLSLNATTEPPEQIGIFTDAEGMTAITQYEGEKNRLSYLDYTTSALPYHLSKPSDVLILGAGGGSDVLQAKFHDAHKIDAVELNSQMADLLTNTYADLSGNLFNSKGVSLHIDEARGFVLNSNKHYDLIQVALLDAFGASSAGLYALNESYLYTVEALQEYLNKLQPDGYLALTRWIKLPPRDTLKLFATAIDALKKNGVNNPELQLILIRGWQTSTLLIKNGKVSQTEIESLIRFCRERSFDVAYYPDIQRQEANRYNILSQPYFYEAAQALLSEKREDFINSYKFNLEPATDDRPYFFHFFKWEVMNEILQLRQQGGAALLEWGYIILVATLVQAAIASIILIPLPLLLRKKHRLKTDQGISRTKIFIYFGGIGLAFLFIEMAFMQKFILFLHHPLYAASVVLTSFLLFAGLGSAFAQRSSQSIEPQKIVRLAITGICGIGLLYLLILNPLFHLFASIPSVLAILVSISLIAPLAFCMGMPFPLAMTQLGRQQENLIPWAWAVNGCASVISAVLATLLAIEFGFSTVILIAIVIYGAIITAFPKLN